MALPWIAYAAVLAALCVAERNVFPELTRADRFLDLAINVFAFAGLVVAAFLSVAAMKSADRPERRGMLLAGVLAGGVLGPLLGLVLTTNVAHDVDGSTWMLIAPGLGLLFVVVALFVMAAIDASRRRRAG